MSFSNTREFARELDKMDSLASFKDRFYCNEGEIYLDGNSCGLMSKDAEKTLLKSIEAWKTLGINIWTKGDYFLYQDKLAKLMAPLLNADPSEVTVANSTTVNIHQVIRTFYHPKSSRTKIIMDDLNFPTDRYAVESILRTSGLDPKEHLIIVESRDGNLIFEDDMIEAMTEDVAIILLPAVLYRSAQLIDMKRITEEAHKRGIIAGFDLCHSIGAVPHDFDDIEPDFAIWCDYKYLNAGPGAIAGLYLNKKHFELEPGMAGWQGNRKDTQFNLLPEFEHAGYAGGLQIGTQPIFSMAPLEGSLLMFQEAGIENVRQKSLKITRYLMDLIDDLLKPYGFSYINPTEDDKRGGHVALIHEKALSINEAMKEKNIVPDFRYPDVIRLAPVALYVSYEDVWETVQRIKDIMETKAYLPIEEKILRGEGLGGFVR